MADTGFDPSWLNERFPFDADARNMEVEQQALQNISLVNNPVLVDLGAGNGANCKYFLGKIPIDHTWIFIEQDPQLIQASKDNLSSYAIGRGGKVTPTAEGLIIDFPNQQVIVKMVRGSLLEVDSLIDLSTVHLVMANAVFDLFPKYLFAAVASIMATFKIPFLTTLNYNSMRFIPTRENDAKFVAQYEAHMQQEKPGGAGMGKTCSMEMYSVLEDREAKVIIGISTWKIGKKDQAMHTFLYNYMDTCLNEMEQTMDESKQLTDWLKEKKGMIEAKELQLEVGHYDIFAKF